MKYEFKRGNWIEFGQRLAGLFLIVTVVLTFAGLYASLIGYDNWLTKFGTWVGITFAAVIGALIVGAILYKFISFFFIDPFRKKEPKHEPDSEGEGGTVQLDRQLADNVQDREAEA